MVCLCHSGRGPGGEVALPKSVPPALPPAWGGWLPQAFWSWDNPELMPWVLPSIPPLNLPGCGPWLSLLKPPEPKPGSVFLHGLGGGLSEGLSGHCGPSASWMAPCLRVVAPTCQLHSGGTDFCTEPWGPGRPHGPRPGV